MSITEERRPLYEQYLRDLEARKARFEQQQREYQEAGNKKQAQRFDPYIADTEREIAKYEDMLHD